MQTEIYKKLKESGINPKSDQMQFLASRIGIKDLVLEFCHPNQEIDTIQTIDHN